MLSKNVWQIVQFYSILLVKLMPILSETLELLLTFYILSVWWDFSSVCVQLFFVKPRHLNVVLREWDCGIWNFSSTRRWLRWKNHIVQWSIRSNLRDLTQTQSLRRPALYKIKSHRRINLMKCKISGWRMAIFRRTLWEKRYDAKTSHAWYFLIIFWFT